MPECCYTEWNGQALLDVSPPCEVEPIPVSYSFDPYTCSWSGMTTKALGDGIHSILSVINCDLLVEGCEKWSNTVSTDCPDGDISITGIITSCEETGDPTGPPVWGYSLNPGSCGCPCSLCDDYYSTTTPLIYNYSDSILGNPGQQPCEVFRIAGSQNFTIPNSINIPTIMHITGKVNDDLLLNGNVIQNNEFLNGHPCNSGHIIDHCFTYDGPRTFTVASRDNYGDGINTSVVFRFCYECEGEAIIPVSGLYNYSFPIEKNTTLLANTNIPVQMDTIINVPKCPYNPFPMPERTLILSGSSTEYNAVGRVFYNAGSFLATTIRIQKEGTGTWVLTSNNKWRTRGSGSGSEFLLFKEGSIILAGNAYGGSGMDSIIGAQNGPIPILGSSSHTGPVSLLMAQQAFDGTTEIPLNERGGSTFSRVLQIPSGVTNSEVILGGSSYPSQTGVLGVFDANSGFRIGSDSLTLACDDGGVVRFLTPKNNWQKSDGSANPEITIKIGTLTMTGNIKLETVLPSSIIEYDIAYGNLIVGPILPDGYSSVINTATFTPLTLDVVFANEPNIGDSFKLLNSPTVQSYIPENITLIGVTGTYNPTYNSLISTLVLDS